VAQSTAGAVSFASPLSMLQRPTCPPRDAPAEGQGARRRSVTRQHLEGDGRRPRPQGDLPAPTGWTPATMGTTPYN